MNCQFKLHYQDKLCKWVFHHVTGIGTLENMAQKMKLRLWFNQQGILGTAVFIYRATFAVAIKISRICTWAAGGSVLGQLQRHI